MREPCIGPNKGGQWEIDFEDKESSLFKAVVDRLHRPAAGNGAIASEDAPETQDLHHKTAISGADLHNAEPDIAPELFAILECMSANPRITATELANLLGVSRSTILSRIRALKEKGMLRRIGPNKGGQWAIAP